MTLIFCLFFICFFSLLFHCKNCICPKIKFGNVNNEKKKITKKVCFESVHFSLSYFLECYYLLVHVELITNTYVRFSFKAMDAIYVTPKGLSKLVTSLSLRSLLAKLQNVGPVIPICWITKSSLVMCLVLPNPGFHYTVCLDCPDFSKKSTGDLGNYVIMETAVESWGVIKALRTIVIIIALIDLWFFSSGNCSAWFCNIITLLIPTFF